MATYSLTINERKSAGKALLNYLLSLDFVKIDKKNGLDQAIDDFKNGNTVKCNDFDDYLEKINS